ncbi:MAG: hypothetical protein ACLTLO_01715 [Coprococcus sp.]|jgi:hypothetical protein
MAEKIAIDDVLFADMESFLTQDLSFLKDELSRNRDAIDAAFEQVSAQSPVMDTIKSILNKMVNLVNDYYRMNKNVIKNYLKIGRELQNQDEVIHLSLTALQGEAMAQKWEKFNQSPDVKDHLSNVYRAAGYNIPYED